MDRSIWLFEAGAWQQAGSLGVVPGPVTALTVADGIVWLGSSDGVTSWDPRSNEQRRYSFAVGDLVAGDRGETFVTAISVSTPDVVWIATPAGAVRLAVDR
jgi:hypothetical protein